MNIHISGMELGIEYAMNNESVAKAHFEQKESHSVLMPVSRHYRDMVIRFHTVQRFSDIHQTYTNMSAQLRPTCVHEKTVTVHTREAGPPLSLSVCNLRRISRAFSLGSM